MTTSGARLAVRVSVVWRLVRWITLAAGRGSTSTIDINGTSRPSRDFTVNAASSGNPKLRTTAQAFGCYVHGNPANCPPQPHQMAVHTYTIVDAINDKNVLPFRIDYVNTIRLPETARDVNEQVAAIEERAASRR